MNASGNEFSRPRRTPTRTSLAAILDSPRDTGPSEGRRAGMLARLGLAEALGEVVERLGEPRAAERALDVARGERHRRAPGALELDRALRVVAQEEGEAGAVLVPRPQQA